LRGGARPPRGVFGLVTALGTEKTSAGIPFQTPCLSETPLGRKGRSTTCRAE
jgi:hypothetical protein